MIIQRSRGLIARLKSLAKPAKNQTPITQMSGSATIKDNIAKFNAMDIDDIHLMNNSLQYRLNINTTKASNLDQYTLSFISQPSSLKINRDTAELLKQVANIEIPVPQLTDQFKTANNKNDSLGKP